MAGIANSLTIPAELLDDNNVKPKLGNCQRHHESGAVLAAWKLPGEIAISWHVLDETRAISRDIRQDVVGRFPEFEVGSLDFFGKGSIGADILKKGPPPFHVGSAQRFEARDRSAREVRQAISPQPKYF